MKKNIFINFVIFFVFFLKLAHSEELIGIPEVIDGDTLKINEKKIRLFGIDAPESKQLCKKVYLSIFIFSFHKEYLCGDRSTLNLKKYIKHDILNCKVKGKDRYKRYLAICYKNNTDLNEWLVSTGNAVAYRKYSKKYILYENEAKKKKIGLWSGIFEMPWDWRKKN